MMFRLLLIVSALILTGCGASEPQRPIRVSAVAALTGPEAEAVEVRVVEMPPGTVIEGIALVDPEGGRQEATQFQRANQESGPNLQIGPIVGLGAYGGSSSGINPVVNLGYGGTRGGPTIRTQQVSTRIPVPDPAGYLDQVRDWRVEVRYLDVTGTPQMLTLRAPRTTAGP